MTLPSDDSGFIPAGFDSVEAPIPLPGATDEDEPLTAYYYCLSLRGGGGVAGFSALTPRAFDDAILTAADGRCRRERRVYWLDGGSFDAGEVIATKYVIDGAPDQVQIPPTEDEETE